MLSGMAGSPASSNEVGDGEVPRPPSVRDCWALRTGQLTSPQDQQRNSHLGPADSFKGI